MEPPLEIEGRLGSPHLRTSRFSQDADELDEAVRWLHSHAQRRVSGTRIARYQATLRQLTKEVESGKLQEFFERASMEEKAAKYGEAMLCLYETGEFLSIYHGARAIAAVVEPLKLAELLKGQISYLDENANSAKARNTAFELIVAARLSQIGLPLIPLPPADLSAQLGEFRLVLECKRPQSRDTLDQNLKDAFKQLRVRLNSLPLPNMRGIAAIDLTKATNPSFNFFRAEGIPQLTRGIAKPGDDFAHPRMVRWRGMRHRHVVGVLIRFSAIVEVAETNRPVYAQQYTLAGLCLPDTPDGRLTRRLADLLQRTPLKTPSGGT